MFSPVRFQCSASWGPLSEGSTCRTAGFAAVEKPDVLKTFMESAEAWRPLCGRMRTLARRSGLDHMYNRMVPVSSHLSLSLYPNCNRVCTGVQTAGGIRTVCHLLGDLSRDTRFNTAVCGSLFSAQLILHGAWKAGPTSFVASGEH